MHGKSFNRKKNSWNVKCKMEHIMLSEKFWKLVREEYRVNIKFSFTFIYVFISLHGFRTTRALKFCRVFFLYPAFMLIWSRLVSGSSILRYILSGLYYNVQ